MAKQLLVKQPETATPVKVVPAQDLTERLNGMKEAIARRAYEIFESHGRTHGHDVDDWLRAESELLHHFPHTVAETESACIIFAELPGFWDASELLVGVGPHRVIVYGEREVQVTFSDNSGTRMEHRPQSILRVLDLTVSVDPSRATASLSKNALEIVMPKTQPT